jgi:hypothetical protein
MYLLLFCIHSVDESVQDGMDNDDDDDDSAVTVMIIAAATTMITTTTTTNMLHTLNVKTKVMQGIKGKLELSQTYSETV